MAKSNIHRRSAATIVTSKHYYKKKKKRITITTNLIHQLRSHSIFSSKKHQFSREHQIFSFSIHQIENQPNQHETTNLQPKNTNQPKPFSALRAQPSIKFPINVATPLKHSFCLPS